MHRLPHAARAWPALLLSLVCALATLAVPVARAETGAQPAGAGAAWLAGQVSAAGYVGGSDMQTSGSVTVYTGLALAAADAERAAFDRVLAWMEAHHREFTVDGNGVPRPGAAGQVALLAAAAGRDPRDFGDADLVAQIRAGETPAGVDAGMYGVVNTAAAVFLHSFAMLGLRAAGVAPSAQAVQWLRAQQCPNGAWPAYRSATHRTQGTCPSTGAGSPEADATAMAIQALAVEGAVPAGAADGLRLLQTANGSFAFMAGSSPNANSSGLAVQAIVAMGQDPEGTAWRKSGGSALSGLLAFQAGCAEPNASYRGGFRWMASSSRPDVLATSQGVWGAARRAFPFPGPPSSSEAEICPAAAPTTPPASEPTTSASPDPVGSESTGGGSGGGGSGGTPTGGQTPAPEPLPSPTAAPGPVNRSVERVAGADRYASAAAVSYEAFPPAVPVAYLTTGDGFADALAAGPAATAGGGPILLTAHDHLPAVVAAELQRLRPGRIVALGGRSAVSDAVLSQAAAYGPVTRVSGRDRYDTAAALSRAVFSPGVQRVLIATGLDYPDALAGIGARPDGPLLLVTPTSVPTVTAEELRRLGPREVLVLGGTAAIGDAVVDRLRETVSGTVRRVSGGNRFETAVLLLREGVEQPRVLYVASGTSYPDALAAAAAAGFRRTGVLLITADSAPPVVLEEIHRVNPLRVLALGGRERIGDHVLDQLAGA